MPTVFGRAADLFDRATVEAIGHWDWAVEQTEGTWGFYPTALAASAAQGFLAIGRGFADVLRLGEGVQQGTVSGVGQDALRLLVVAGGVVRVTGMLLRQLRLLRLANVGPQAAGSTNCTWVSALSAARSRGFAYFISMDHLARIANIAPAELAAMRAGVSGGTSVQQWRQLITALRRVANATTTHQPGSLPAVLRLSANSPTSAFIVATEYGPQLAQGGRAGHTIFVSGGRFIDTSGQAFASYSELAAVYPSATLAGSTGAGTGYLTIQIPQAIVLTAETAALSAEAATAGQAIALAYPSTTVALRVFPSSENYTHGGLPSAPRGVH